MSLSQINFIQLEFIRQIWSENGMNEFCHREIHLGEKILNATLFKILCKVVNLYKWSRQLFFPIRPCQYKKYYLRLEIRFFLIKVEKKDINFPAQMKKDARRTSFVKIRLFSFKLFPSH